MEVKPHYRNFVVSLAVRMAPVTEANLEATARGAARRATRSSRAR